MRGMMANTPEARTILIAERDPNVRALQLHFLSAAGFTVEFADDGEAALELARLMVPSLIVSEILLPKLDGLSLCRRLRRDTLTRRVPVIIFSILAAGVRASEAGASAFLRKPLVESIFVGTIESILAALPTAEMEHQWASQ